MNPVPLNCVCAQTRSIRLQLIPSRRRNMQLKLLNMSKSDWITRKNSQIHFVLQRIRLISACQPISCGRFSRHRLRYRQFGANSHPRPEKRLDYMCYTYFVGAYARDKRNAIFCLTNKKETRILQFASNTAHSGKIAEGESNQLFEVRSMNQNYK